MARFTTVLCAGGKSPYNRWTFLVLPDTVATAWGPGRFEIRGTINHVPFVGRAAWGEGVLRVPLATPLREALGVATGDRVTVTLERAEAPPVVALPTPLADLLSADRTLRRAFDALPPSARRAWAAHIAAAKRPETLVRRLTAARIGIRARKYP